MQKLKLLKVKVTIKSNKFVTSFHFIFDIIYFSFAIINNIDTLRYFYLSFDIYFI